MFRASRVAHALAAMCAGFLVVAAPLSSATPKFYADDPLSREIETQDASGAQEFEVDLIFDLALNLFSRPGDSAENVRAGNINTIDEVPDSNWFTNRILARPVSTEEAARGPLSGPGPAPGPWTIVRDKRAGAAPGFTMRDARGETWFVSFDARGFPEAATGALLVANKIFWTIGYWQVENHLTTVRPEMLMIGDAATIRVPSGVRRPWKRSDLEDVLRRAHRSSDGSYRAVAARTVPGRVVGQFSYFGTRSDDPNDIIPHEHRRELRALKVFGAWTNLVDMKAGNTLDTVITGNGRSVVRHYLQDVGSTFGSGANAPHDYDEGWEHLFEGDLTLKRLVSLGFYLRPWQTLPYQNHQSIGRFEGDAFDAANWKPRVPTAAFLRARPDDTFWAARRVMAFSDEMIRSIVKTGEYSDPAAERYLADVLIKRRDAIGRAYLTAINPIVDPLLDAAGVLTFRNAAVEAGLAKTPESYRAIWSAFDNATGETRPLGDVSGPGSSLQASEILPARAGGYITVELSAHGGLHPSWEKPVHLYFRQQDASWRLVGLERLPEGERPTAE
jgi:hypothetical protein